jgi:L-alanine-DL-glutamate epimerase-like enolase superfamily enzyme
LPPHARNSRIVRTLSVTVEPLELPLVHPFKIARSEETVARTAVVRVGADGREGIGEATPISRYGESVESVLAFFEDYKPATSDPYELETLLDERIPPAARAGFDIALHDWIGKDLGKPLYALFGLDPKSTPITSFTIGIATPDETLAKVAETGDHPVLKLKIGAGPLDGQVEIVRLVRERFSGTLRLDANEGWTPQDAVAMLRRLERFGIECCEQPIPAGNPQALKTIRERSNIPIVADEDAHSAASLPELYGCVDGVNVKLAKTGGLRGALAMIHTARAMNMRVMIGCMVESAIAATAAAHLSPLADWVDIDGPFLTAYDPFRGVTYDRGKLVLPDAPGLGVRDVTA